MIEIEPLDKDGFLKVRETLTRVGIQSKRPEEGLPTLHQICHILHKEGQYFICHFKQLFLLDGKTKTTDYTEKDEDRLFKVANLLEDWGLIKPKEELERVNCHVLAIPFKNKNDYILRSNYKIGGTKHD